MYAFSLFFRSGVLVPCFRLMARMAPVRAPHSEPCLAIPAPKAVAIFGISSFLFRWWYSCIVRRMLWAQLYPCLKYAAAFSG